MEHITVNDIKSLIEQKEYKKARECMDAFKMTADLYTDEMAALDAGIYEALGDRENMFWAIRDGLKYFYGNYELYYILGYYYLPQNANQAYLCFQNALFYCHDKADAAVITADMEELKASGQVTVNNTAIVIVSYNACYMMQKNVESIRNTLLPGTYRIIAVDNASTDGIREWLREQSDITLLENEQNVGFPSACNQAVRALETSGGERDDILLLNNDTRLAPNSLFWLRMGLYEEQKIGAAGAMSNYAGNNQQLDVEFTLPGEYLDYGAARNIPDEAPYEERVRLCGFAMLIRGSVWNEVEGMDEVFSPGYIEDDDISMKILKTGHRLLLCHNSFIYHAGSQSFSQYNNLEGILQEHHRIFKNKYGFDTVDYAYPKREYAEGIPYSTKDAFNLLQIGSGLGADLKYIRSVFPRANVVGIEENENLCAVSANTELIFPNLLSIQKIFKQPTFHVVILSDRERSRLSRKDADILAQLCLAQCVVLPKY